MKTFLKWLLVFAVGMVYFIAAPVIYQSLRFKGDITPLDVGMLIATTGLILLVGTFLVVVVIVGLALLGSWLLKPEEKPEE